MEDDELYINFTEDLSYRFCQYGMSYLGPVGLVEASDLKFSRNRHLREALDNDIQSLLIFF